MLNKPYYNPEISQVGVVSNAGGMSCHEFKGAGCKVCYVCPSFQCFPRLYSSLEGPLITFSLISKINYSNKKENILFVPIFENADLYKFILSIIYIFTLIFCCTTPKCLRFAPYNNMDSNCIKCTLSQLKCTNLKILSYSISYSILMISNKICFSLESPLYLWLIFIIMLLKNDFIKKEMISCNESKHYFWLSSLDVLVEKVDLKVCCEYVFIYKGFILSIINDISADLWHWLFSIIFKDNLYINCFSKNCVLCIKTCLKCSSFKFFKGKVFLLMNL